MFNKNLKLNFQICVILTILFYGFILVLPFNAFSAEPEPTLELEYPQTVFGTTVTGESDLAQYLKYIFEAGMAIGISLAVLTLIISSIFYFLAPVSPNSLAIAKERVTGAISGLLILLLTYLIITAINPYLSIFKINQLEEIPPPIMSEQPGVLFYKSKDCSNGNTIYNTSASDLGDDLTNKVRSVQISQDPANNIYYISILYDNMNYWGSCQYINPNTGCQEVKISPASASIYTYDFNPKGDGVYIYRKSFDSVSGKEKNKDGGYLKIKNSEIKTSAGKPLYFKSLSQLSFLGEKNECTVPKEEQDCAQWNDDGRCEKYKCPNLNKENISSISLVGNYLVVLIYIDPNDRNMVYTYCQAFPTKDDYNKIGPQQIKWDPIRSSEYEPTHILIIPVKTK